MSGTAPPLNDQEFAHASTSKSNPWKLIFRIVRWSTYAGALLMLVLIFHKAPPPIVETSPQAAARVEEKFQDVTNAVSHGQPATLRMDETELNSYLTSHLDFTGSPALAQATGSAAAPGVGNAAAGGSPNAGIPSGDEVEQMRSNVKDVKVQLIDGLKFGDFEKE